MSAGATEAAGFRLADRIEVSREAVDRQAPLLAQVQVQLEGGQASRVCDGATPHGQAVRLGPATGLIP
ncbi:MAG: hypothetical protein C0426_10675 [Rhodobacter sp.]|nr:hypothetical protein [Rhodobacter sp.]